MKWIAAFLAAALVVAPAHARTFRLDDSASPRQRVETSPRWAHESAGELDEDAINALVAEVRGMEFRLNTAPYVGREASVYLALPQSVRGLRASSAMRLEWTTRGRFASGSVLPGDRALIYQGTIREPLLVEHFDFRIHIDGRHFDRGLEFEPVFEIDLPDR